MDDFLVEMEKFARQNKIPVVLPETRMFLEELCKKEQPKQILEIGMAIGFSGSVMLKSCDAFLTTCEASLPNIEIAKRNFALQNLTKRVKIVEGDCIKTLPTLNGQKFDLVFLDGPKGLYLEILKLVLPLLSSNGTLVADNVLFRGMVSGKNKISENRFKTTVAVLKEFNDYLTHNKNFDAQILDIGDGLCVARFKKENRNEV